MIREWRGFDYENAVMGQFEVVVKSSWVEHAFRRAVKTFIDPRLQPLR